MENNMNILNCEQNNRTFLPKSILVFLISLLLLSSAAVADKGRGGLGKLVGVGVGAVTGKIAEKEIEEAMNKDTYEGDGYVLSTQGILLLVDDGNVFLKIQNPADSAILGEFIKTTNRIEVTKKAEWGDLHGNVVVCEEDTAVCSTILIDVVKEKTLFLKFVMYNNPEETFDLLLYESEEPGVLDYIRAFVINNVLWVAIVLFGILGGIWDFVRKRRHKKSQETAAESPAEETKDEQ